MNILRLSRGPVLMFTMLALLTGLVYPLVMTAFAQVALPGQANGSLITVDGNVVGSILIGQSFSDPKYFWGRPSAAGKDGYDANGSGGSNLAPTNQALIQQVTDTLAALEAANNTTSIPVDLVTTSGSGLDPQISPAAADVQVARVAQARGIGDDVVRAAVARHTEGSWLGFVGEPRVNVLALNLDLDGISVK
ncbi:MAG TPA: potassium-transporting ATPase subunit KdpC [Candidatus Dormibacteraeota bacterium]|nr:potassium-transporting ATPase subunit KdpC [Candidatus Dormibacteraeota bacterium]